jgi:hypothetical protein
VYGSVSTSLIGAAAGLRCVLMSITKNRHRSLISRRFTQCCLFYHEGQVNPVAVGLHKYLKTASRGGLKHAWCFHCGLRGLSWKQSRERFHIRVLSTSHLSRRKPDQPHPKGYQILCIRAILCSLPDSVGGRVSVPSPPHIHSPYIPVSTSVRKPHLSPFRSLISLIHGSRPFFHGRIDVSRLKSLDLELALFRLKPLDVELDV